MVDGAGNWMGQLFPFLQKLEENQARGRSKNTISPKITVFYNIVWFQRGSILDDSSAKSEIISKL